MPTLYFMAQHRTEQQNTTQHNLSIKSLFIFIMKLLCSIKWFMLYMIGWSIWTCMLLCYALMCWWGSMPLCFVSVCVYLSICYKIIDNVDDYIHYNSIKQPTTAPQTPISITISIPLSIWIKYFWGYLTEFSISCILKFSHQRTYTSSLLKLLLIINDLIP